MKQLKWYKKYQEWSLRFFKKYWKYNLLVIFIFFIMFLINVYYSDKKEEEYAKKYPYYKTSSLISGKVLYIETLRQRIGEGITFSLDNQKGYSLGWADNEMYVPSKISEFLQIGDSIYKASGTDSVLIYRNEGVYYFEISKRIDKDGNYY